MSDVIQGLLRGRDVAWRDLIPVFDCAIGLAQRAERMARVDAYFGEIPVEPDYPLIVLLLAESHNPGGEV